MLIIGPVTRARRELAGWERDTEVNFSEDDKELLINFMVKVFSLEDLTHLQAEAVDDEPLFTEDELKQINELAEKYPVFSLAILDFFRDFLGKKDSEEEV
jgi:hypothetical protein